MTEKYGCVLLRLKTTKTFDKIKKIIKQEDLDGDGIEKETHVTVCYGLHKEVTTEQVKAALDGLDCKEVEITGMSLFENDKDVLKLDVKVSKGLLALRKAVMELPNTQSFPDYKPHVTLAYLKKGIGKKYLPSKEFTYRMKVEEIIFSYPNRTKQELIYETVRYNRLLK